MGVDCAVLADVPATVRRGLPNVELDRWAPSVQGAVGHVMGMRGMDGAPYVLKIYPRPADHRLTTEVLAACPAPVLCHNDFIDDNLLVSESAQPRLRGVIDLERASRDDPLSDLAQTRLHVRYHGRADASPLTEAYGVDTSAERQRLDAYELLHAAAERTWTTPRPPERMGAVRRGPRPLHRSSADLSSTVHRVPACTAQ